MLVIIIFFVAHWYLSLFSQTFLHHRYAAHGAFTMSRFWEKVFYIFAYITQGSSYLSPRAYAIMHRMHHSYTETEDDPHSPTHQSTIMQMMKHTADVFNGIYTGSIEVKEKFKKNVPDWPLMDRIGHSWTSRIIWGTVYVGFYLLFAPSLWWLLLVPVHAFIGPIHGAVINWFAHKYGYTNFKLDNTSKNLVPLDLFMLGEAYHNNHHKHPSGSNFGVRWHEIDPVYPIIWLFHRLGIIQVNKLSS